MVEEVVLLVAVELEKTKGKEATKSAKDEKADRGVWFKVLSIPKSFKCIVFNNSLVSYKVLERIILKHMKLVEDL